VHRASGDEAAIGGGQHIIELSHALADHIILVEVSEHPEAIASGGGTQEYALHITDLFGSTAGDQIAVGNLFGRVEYLKGRYLSIFLLPCNGSIGSIDHGNIRA